MLAERLRLNTQRLLCVRLASKGLSNVWWPLAFKQDNPAAEKSLVLWLNSTLGLISLLVHREETEGAWIDFKKPVLAELPVLAVSSLKAKELKALSKAYDKFCNEEILPFPHMAHDPIRKAIDDIITTVLGLPDITVLRDMLAREPVVCLKNIGSAVAPTLPLKS